jgi:ABC-type transport system involved in cytochrome bd biosynthesis fused ATPase/permease subunit
MRCIALAITVALLSISAQAQDAQREAPAVTGLTNIEAYVGYLRLAAQARACGLRTADWEKSQQAKVTALMVRTVSRTPIGAAPTDGAALAAGAVMAAAQEAKALAPAACEGLKQAVDEFDAALPQEPSTQR